MEKKVKKSILEVRTMENKKRPREKIRPPPGFERVAVNGEPEYKQAKK